MTALTPVATKDDRFVAEALAASRVPELAVPTVAEGEGWEQLLSSADSEGFDPEVAAARGMHYEHLDQLALEHLMGAR